KELREVQRIHRQFQRALKPVDVCIPFSKAISDRIPSSNIEMRRVYPYLLSLIDAVAYLHQFQAGRVRDPETGEIEATYEDYATARRLILGPMHHLIGMGKDYEQCRELAAKLPADGVFSSTEAGKLMAASTRRITLEHLNKLVDFGVVRL